MFTRRNLPAAAIAFVLAQPACRLPALAQEKTITVFAAASMKNALDDVNAAFSKATGIKVVASYAASSALMKQIENGAPADVFVSADLDWMDYGVAEEAGARTTRRINLLGNRLVLIAPKDSKIGEVTIGPGFDLARLAGDGRIATGDVRAVPVGKYAKAALEKLGVWASAQSQDRHGGERARGARAGRARRSGARHRLRDRRQGRAEREDRRPLPGRLAPADRLPGGADRSCETRGSAVSRLPALAGGQGRVRGHTASRFWCGRRRSIETACSTSARTNGPRSTCRCGSRWWRRSWRCRSASRWRGCWRARSSGARRCSTGSSICRWCCRRW